ncbi:MAG: FHA domain-containing protein [Candidatus Melainabacteria bacterium]|nr:FHA domain-containing protein [Candidatus Melainabacteria bacterium]
MATTCTVCKRSYNEELCPYCTVTDVKVSDLTDKLHLQHGGDGAELPTAFLVDLVSNRKIPITTPRCKVGRDDLNDIVISGDQSISRFHFVITKDNDQYMVQDSKSRHGTFLNGNQIAGPIPINDGDVLKVGVSLFWFVIENQAVGSAADQFSPVDIETIDAQEMKVSAGDTTTPNAPTRETDISSMTSLKEVLAQAKAKESGFNEAEMSKTIAPREQEKAIDKAADKAEEKQEKPADKGTDKSSDKSDQKSDFKDSRDPKDWQETKDQKDSKTDSDSKDFKAKREEERETAKMDEPPQGLEHGLQITASMLLDALEHKSLAEVSKLDDRPKEKDKAEETESKDKDKDPGKKTKDEDDAPSEIDLQGLFSDDNGNLDKTAGEKEAADSNNKDHESSTSDKITGSQASTDKAPEEKAKDEPKSNNEDFSPDASDKTESDSETVSKSTLDKMSDTVQEMSNSVTSESNDRESSTQEEKSEPQKQTKSKLEEAELIASQLFEQEIVEKTKNGAWSGNTMQDTKVPDWCSKYFASELNLLVKDLDNLNEQVRNAQSKIKEVENRLAATKSLRNTLLTATGEDLVEACGKVLARLGWRVKIVEDDKQELRLESDDKVSICRIIWTPGLPERTHLGQLSIAQTRFWCEQGAEPKGILIAAQAEDKPPPKITDSDYSGELADYASKKNVLMLTTLQLLAMYKEVALNEGSAEALRSSIHTSSGWLKGYSLDPSDEDEKEPGKLASASI